MLNVDNGGISLSLVKIPNEAKKAFFYHNGYLFYMSVYTFTGLKYWTKISCSMKPLWTENQT